MITHTLIVPKKASTVTFDLSGTRGKRCMRVEVYGKPVKGEGRHYFVKSSNKHCVNVQFSIIPIPMLIGDSERVEVSKATIFNGSYEELN